MNTNIINVILNGCGGYMGKVLTGLIQARDDMEVVAGVDITPPPNMKYPIYLDFNDCTIDCDVIIDFTHPSSLNSMLKFAKEKKSAIVIATTGYSLKEENLIVQASKYIPIFKSSSMSLGINLLKKLLGQATKAIGEEFDIEIIERHHNRKVDAPSGTALMLADAINDNLKEKREYNCSRHGKSAKREQNEIGIHALRGGTIVGDHEVIFAGNDEIIEIRHSSLSRDSFASGAIRAAQYVFNKNNGMYNMDDMI